MEPSPLEELEQLLIDGLLQSGEHHKQWYLEEALKEVGRQIGRPFPEDFGKVMLNLGEMEKGEPDNRWVSLTAHWAYVEGIAP